MWGEDLRLMAKLIMPLQQGSGFRVQGLCPSETNTLQHHCSALLYRSASDGHPAQHMKQVELYLKPLMSQSIGCSTAFVSDMDLYLLFLRK